MNGTSTARSSPVAAWLSKAEVLQRILAARRDISAEALSKLIEVKKRELGPLLTDEGAAYLVSQDLAVELFEEPATRLESPIGGLVPGLKDVSVAGRILVAHTPRSFIREDGSHGCALRLILADRTGFARVVLWNGKVDEFSAKGLAEGREAGLLHGYTREDPDGGVEVHIGEKAAIEPLHDSARANLFPLREALSVKIGSLGPVGGSVWTEAVVARAEPASVFEKEGGEGRVRRLVLQDETGRISLVLWNEEIDGLGPIEEGSRVSVMCGVMKPGLTGEPEIHLRRWGRVAVVPAEVEPSVGRAGIAELEKLGGNSRVEAVIVAAAPLKEFTLPDGKAGRALSLLLGDETGMARLTVWDEAVDDGLGLKEGDIVEFQPTSFRRRFGDLELHLRKRGFLSKLASRSHRAPSWVERLVSIRDLDGRRGYVTVEGVAGTVPSARRVTTAKGRETQVVSFSLGDSSGEVRVSAWGALADKAMGLAAGSHVRLRHGRVVRGCSGERELSTSVFSSLEVTGEEKA